jgi:hypothetical protein
LKAHLAYLYLRRRRLFISKDLSPFSRKKLKGKENFKLEATNSSTSQTTQSANQHININISYGLTCPAQKVHTAPRFKLTLQTAYVSNGTKTTVGTVQNTGFIRNPGSGKKEPSSAARYGR